MSNLAAIVRSVLLALAIVFIAHGVTDDSSLLIGIGSCLVGLWHTRRPQ